MEPATTPQAGTWEFFESDMQSDKWSQKILESLSISISRAGVRSAIRH